MHLHPTPEEKRAAKDTARVMGLIIGAALVTYAVGFIGVRILIHFSGPPPYPIESYGVCALGFLILLSIIIIIIIIIIIGIALRALALFLWALLIPARSD